MGLERGQLGMSIKRALISVYDKEGVISFAKGLVDLGVRLISTGGTFRHLQEAGLPVALVSDITGFPEILSGRVKTLHPKVHGGILARRDHPEDLNELKSADIPLIDLVAVNLYPFSQTVAKEGVTITEALEQIDIGGPTMIRAAAKNFPFIVVCVSPRRYPEILERLQQDGDLSPQFRAELAAEAFDHTAKYDRAIHHYLIGEGVSGEIKTKDEAKVSAGDQGPTFGSEMTLELFQGRPLRYGENPHQPAAFYTDPSYSGTSLARAKQLHGTELSYNNIMDAAAALEMVREFNRPAAAAVKHTNPCGLAVANTLDEAFQRAYDADPTSIFGGIVACNRPVDAATARIMSEIFLHVVLAPSFLPEAMDILTKKANLRLLEVGEIEPPQPYLDFRRVPGGFLVQEADMLGPFDKEEVQVVTQRSPTDEEWRDLVFGWIAVKHVKSNAIVVAKDETAIGVGAGQMNRILPTRLALEQAGDKAKGAILASDAFFPFPDVTEAAKKAGITAIIQPGGAKRDAESIEVADEAGIAMVFTGIRHFKH